MEEIAAWSLFGSLVDLLDDVAPSGEISIGRCKALFGIWFLLALVLFLVANQLDNVLLLVGQFAPLLLLCVALVFLPRQRLVILAWWFCPLVQVEFFQVSLNLLLVLHVNQFIVGSEFVWPTSTGLPFLQLLCLSQLSALLFGFRGLRVLVDRQLLVLKLMLIRHLLVVALGQAVFALLLTSVAVVTGGVAAIFNIVLLLFLGLVFGLG